MPTTTTTTLKAPGIGPVGPIKGLSDCPLQVQWPELNHCLFIYSYCKTVHEYRLVNCTGWTCTVGTTLSCRDDFSSIFCSQQRVLLMLQYSIFGQISLTILYFTHIKAILMRIARPLASSIKIPWLVLFKLNTIPNLLIRGKSYHLRKCGE